MKLPQEIADAVVKAAGKELAASLKEYVQDLQLFTLQEVADRLKVSKGTANRLVKEYVELGEASRRVTPATLRRLIEERTIRTK
jgi:DNA-binding MarR family transcriptional regulator